MEMVNKVKIGMGIGGLLLYVILYYTQQYTHNVEIEFLPLVTDSEVLKNLYEYLSFLSPIPIGFIDTIKFIMLNFIIIHLVSLLSSIITILLLLDFDNKFLKLSLQSGIDNFRIDCSAFSISGKLDNIFILIEKVYHYILLLALCIAAINDIINSNLFIGVGIVLSSLVRLGSVVYMISLLIPIYRWGKLIKAINTSYKEE